MQRTQVPLQMTSDFRLSCNNFVTNALFNLIPIYMHSLIFLIHKSVILLKRFLINTYIDDYAYMINKGINRFFYQKVSQYFKRIEWAIRLLLVKCNDNKMVKSPYNCVIFTLTQPQVANQQEKKYNLQRLLPSHSSLAKMSYHSVSKEHSASRTLSKLKNDRGTF